MLTIRFLYSAGFLLLAVLQSPTLSAQPPRKARPNANGPKGAKGQGGPKEFTESFDERFLRRKPMEGEKLPKVDCVDADGMPFDFAKTHGSYRVLVFGCLT